MSVAFHSLVSGSLVKDAEPKVSSSGKDYVAVTIRTESEPPLFVRASIWGDDAETVLKLKRGDGIAVVGKLDIGIWQSTNGPAPSLQIMAHRAISPTAKRPSKPRAAPKPNQAALFQPRTVPNSDGLADDIFWAEQP